MPGSSSAKERANARLRRRHAERIASASEVKKMKPERDEIIICTALNLKASGVQIWGLAASGISAMRYAR